MQGVKPPAKPLQTLFPRKGLLLPIPRSNTVNGCDLNNEKLAERNKSNLEEVVAKMNIAMKEKYGGLMPTPQASEGEKYTNKWNPNSQMGKSLSAMAGSGILPTPQGRDWKGRTNPGVKKVGSGCVYGETLPDAVTRLQKISAGTDGQTSRLSPLFTEEMMGFPFLWTALPFLRTNGEQNHSKLTETP